MKKKIDEVFDYLYPIALKYGSFIPDDVVYHCCLKNDIDERGYLLLLEQLQKNSIFISKSRKKKTFPAKKSQKSLKRNQAPKNTRKKKNGQTIIQYRSIQKTITIEPTVKKVSNKIYYPEKNKGLIPENIQNDPYFSRLFEYFSVLPDSDSKQDLYVNFHNRIIEQKVSSITKYAYRFAVNNNLNPEEVIEEALYLLVITVKINSIFSDNLEQILHVLIKKNLGKDNKASFTEQYELFDRIIKKNNCISCKKVSNCPRIVGEIRESISDPYDLDENLLLDFLVTIPIDKFYEESTDYDVSQVNHLSCYIANQPIYSQDHTSDDQINIEKVLEEILTPRELSIIKMRFGFESNEKNLQQIAKEVKLSRERVRQILDLSLKKLRKRIKSQYSIR